VVAVVEITLAVVVELVVCYKVLQRLHQVKFILLLLALAEV
jgi:hypothetical protein